MNVFTPQNAAHTKAAASSKEINFSETAIQKKAHKEMLLKCVILDICFVDYVHLQWKKYLLTLLNINLENVMQWNLLRHRDICKINMEIVTEVFYNMRRKNELNNSFNKLYTHTQNANSRQRKNNTKKNFAHL